MIRYPKTTPSAVAPLCTTREDSSGKPRRMLHGLKWGQGGEYIDLPCLLMIFTLITNNWIEKSHAYVSQTFDISTLLNCNLKMLI